MESTSCPDCGRQFSRNDNMHRHRRQMHSYPPPPPGTLPPPPPTSPPPPPPPALKEQFYFTIPSNTVVVGPSGSDKTMFVYNILLQNRIQPVPNNIIWCYMEWQPLYQIISGQLPYVTFVKGIPYNLHEDNYMDARNNNMIVLDDLMSEAKDDKRISQLFTSHHKNVIIFLLLQNLFPRGKESRDIALNSHYVTLFNSPVDRHQVNLFARRIYPNNADQFMSVYKEAVEKPYGNLTIDLRPTTLESGRLQPNVLETVITPQPIKEEQAVNQYHLKPDTRRDYISEVAAPVDSESEDDTATMPSCDECGIDLQRHVRSWCPENGGGPLRKRVKMETADKSDVLQPTMTSKFSEADKEWEVKGLEYMWKHTLKHCQDDVFKKKEEYEDQGKSERWIENKLKKCWEATFLDRMATAIRYVSYFGYGPLFKPILEKVRAMDPDIDSKGLSAKINKWMKPVVKDILSHVDLSEAEDQEREQLDVDDDTDR